MPGAAIGVDQWRRHHDVSILIAAGGVGRYFGSQPRAKVSMMIMRLPQHGHGRGSARGCSSAASGVSGSFARAGRASSSAALGACGRGQKNHRGQQACRRHASPGKVAHGSPPMRGRAAFPATRRGSYPAARRHRGQARARARVRPPTSPLPRSPASCRSHWWRCVPYRGTYRCP